tara:strand:+ start:114566 stop:114883 length:318 start_codon:yes stop_codon:yes gene_type:complete
VAVEADFISFASNHQRTVIPAGLLIVQPDVAKLIVRDALDVRPYLLRHLVDDWGELSEKELRDNAHVILHGGEIFSSYAVSESLTLWIMSEWDRRVTTLALPPAR